MNEMEIQNLKILGSSQFLRTFPSRSRRHEIVHSPRNRWKNFESSGVQCPSTNQCLTMLSSFLLFKYTPHCSLSCIQFSVWPFYHSFFICACCLTIVLFNRLKIAVYRWWKCGSPIPTLCTFFTCQLFSDALNMPPRTFPFQTHLVLRVSRWT